MVLNKVKCGYLCLHGEVESYSSESQFDKVCQETLQYSIIKKITK